MLTRRRLFGLAAAVAFAASVSLPAMAKFEPRFVSREEWGALPPLEDPDTVVYDISQIEYLVVHHTGRIQGIGIENITPNLIQEAHMNMGKSDMAYHRLITPDGLIYEGRPITTMGAGNCPSLESFQDKEKDGILHHPEKSFNYGCLQICFVGDFRNGRQPTSEQNTSALYLARDVADNYLNILHNNVIGHEEAGEVIGEARGITPTMACRTLCPGAISDLIAIMGLEIWDRRQEKPYKEPRRNRNYEIYPSPWEESRSKFA